MNQIIGGATIRLHQDDNVVVAAQNIAAGATIPNEGVVTASAVPSGHKIATRPIPAGDYVRKYNQIIGVATAWHLLDAVSAYLLFRLWASERPR